MPLKVLRHATDPPRETRDLRRREACRLLEQSSIVCPYLDDETTERCAIWMAGYRSFKGDDKNYAESLLL